MNENPKDLLELLNIQIGCIIKINRLRKGISQHDVAQFTSNVAEDLFVLLSESDLLLIVEEIISLEQKLNEEKKEFYRTLISKIKDKYTRLKSMR